MFTYVELKLSSLVATRMYFVLVVLFFLKKSMSILGISDTQIYFTFFLLAEDKKVGPTSMDLS